MARISYNTSTPFGQLISEAVDHLQLARMKINRSAEAVSDMSEAQYQAEIGSAETEYTQFRNRLNDVQTHLEVEKFRNLLVTFDQG